MTTTPSLSAGPAAGVPQTGVHSTMTSTSTSLRFTPEDEEALAYLMAETGATRSEAVRAALQLAVRDLRRARARAQLDEVLADPAQRADLEAAQREMERLSAG